MWPRVALVVSVLVWSLVLVNWWRPRPEEAGRWQGPAYWEEPANQDAASLAVQTLEAADRVFLDAVTDDPLQPVYALSWQLLANHRRADSLFAAVFYRGTHAAQLYALAGLERSRSPYFQYLLEAYRQFQVPIRTVRGCRIRSERPAGLVDELERNGWAVDYWRWSYGASDLRSTLARAVANP